MSKISDLLAKKTKDLIFRLSITFTSNVHNKDCYHLDYEDTRYREKELIKILNQCLPFFALSPSEYLKFKDNNDVGEAISLSWSRISSTDPLKKGDFGELLLFVLLEIFYPARKFVTKVRLRTSQGDQVKGFDCAHFTIENNTPILWLGEAKFHDDYVGALNKAVSSLNLHLTHAYVHKEIDILAANIEYNYNEKGEIDEIYKILENYLNGNISLDKMKFKIPILITYDSDCVNNNNDTNSKFFKELSCEVDKISTSIDGKKLITALSVEFIFIVLPLKSVSWLKQELNKLEFISKEYA